MNDINTANKSDKIYTNMYNAPINNNEIIFVVGDNPTVTFNNNVTVYTYNPTVYEVAEVTEVAIRYGAWFNTIVNLLIVGFVMFMIVKSYNKIKKPEAEVAPAGPTQEDLLAEIRDLLKK